MVVWAVQLMLGPKGSLCCRRPASSSSPTEVMLAGMRTDTPVTDLGVDRLLSGAVRPWEGMGNGMEGTHTVTSASEPHSKVWGNYHSTQPSPPGLNT